MNGREINSMREREKNGVGERNEKHGGETVTYWEKESERDKALKLLRCHCATLRAERKVSIDLHNTA